MNPRMRLGVAVVVLVAVTIVVAGVWLFRKPSNLEGAHAARRPCTNDCKIIGEFSVTVSKGGVTLEIPKPYIKHFDQTRWDPLPNRYEDELQVRWPSMRAFTTVEFDALFKEWDKTDRDPKHAQFLDDLVTIRIRANRELPTPITAAALEKTVLSRYGAPTALRVIPGLQEYGVNSRELAYRERSVSDHLADGLPPYIFCRGTPLAPAPQVLRGGCLMQLTWPNGLEIDLRFNRVHLANWRQIHDSMISLTKSFVVAGNLPSSSLLLPN